jgi:hypothetical protein
MQGVYEVRSKLTDTDRRVGEFGHRLNLLGTHFFNNMSQQTQQPPPQIQHPPAQKFNLTMNMPDVERIGTQMRDNFDHLEEGLNGAFIGLHEQGQRILGGVGASNEVAALFEDDVSAAPAPTTPVMGLKLAGKNPPMDKPQTPPSSAVQQSSSVDDPPPKEEKKDTELIIDDVIKEPETAHAKKKRVRKTFDKSQLETMSDMAVETIDYLPRHMSQYYKTDAYVNLEKSYKGNAGSIKQKIKDIKDALKKQPDAYNDADL